MDVDENKGNKTEDSDENVKIESEVNNSDEEKKVKRSISLDDFDIDLAEVNAIDNNEALNNRIDSINRGLREVQGLFDNKNAPLRRVRRQLLDEDSEIRKKLRRHGLKKFREDHKSIGSGIIEKLMNLPKLDLSKNLKELKLRKSPKFNKNKLSKRNSRNYRNKADDSQENETVDFSARRKRSLFTHANKKHSGDSSENDIDSDGKKHLHFGKFLRRQEMMKEEIENSDVNEDTSHVDDNDEIEINTKITKDDAVFQISENADHGLLKSTFENTLSMLEELNKNLSKVWSALTLLD